jgi:ribosomal protein S18 acetylase RimI-like enzyme
VTDLAERALDTNAANLQLGNETFPLARAVFVRNRETPDIYDANQITAPQARTPTEIDELLAATDRKFAHANHRRFDVDHRTPPEFIARLLLDGGHERSDALISLLEGDLIGQATHWKIRPQTSDADWETFWQLMLVDWTAYMTRTGRLPQEDVGRRMWAARKRKQPPVQYWLASDGERAVGYLNSWEGVGGVGQVEDLFTLPEYRKRGVATALIHHCVARSARKVPAPSSSLPTRRTRRRTSTHVWGFRPVAIQSKYLKRLTTD